MTPEKIFAYAACAMYAFAQGIATSSLLTLYSWREKTLHMGQSHRMTGVYQSREVSIALRSLSEANYLPLAPMTYVALPIAVGLARAHLSIIEPNTRDVLAFLSGYIGSVAHIAAAVSAVALIALGNPAFGSALLIGLALGRMASVRKQLEPYQFALFIISAFVGGSLCEQTVAALHLLLKVRPYIQAAYYKMQSAPQRCDTAKWDKRLDTAHLTMTTEASPPKETRKILDLFDEADWSTMPKRVTKDGRLAGGASIFERIAKWWSTDTRVREVRFMRRELETLVIDLPKLAKKRLAWLAHTYQTTENRDILIDLALEANVCHAGKLGAITEIYMKHVAQPSFEIQVLSRLQEFRYTLFTLAYFKAMCSIPWTFLPRLIDFQNRHVFNTIANKHTGLGLPDMGQHGDSLAQDEAARAVLTPFFRGIEAAVCKEYTQEAILTFLKQEINGGRLQRADADRYLGNADGQEFDWMEDSYLIELLQKMGVIKKPQEGQ